MEISARSFFTTGMSLTAAAAIALAPLPIPANLQTATIPTVTMPAVRLAAVSDDIAAAMAGLQTLFDGASGTAADIVGLPGRGLIGVAGDIETFFDVALTRLIDAAGDPTTLASLTILRTLAVDAWAKLEENLGLINPAITTATEQVGMLLTSALTGSVQNILIAVANVVADPLSLRNYVGLVTAGLASGQLVVGNGLRAIQAVGDAGFDVVGIAVRELTFQFTNLLGGASALLTQLGEASRISLVNAVLGAVRDLVLAPARAVINFNSGLIQVGLTTANAGFDAVLGGATNIIDPRPQEPAAVAAAVPEEEVAAALSDPEPIAEQVVETSGKTITEEVSVEEEAVLDESVEGESAEEESAADEQDADELAADDAASEDSAPHGEAVSDDEASAADTKTENEAPSKSDAPSENDAPSNSSASAAAA